MIENIMEFYKPASKWTALYDECIDGEINR